MQTPASPRSPVGPELTMASVIVRPIGVNRPAPIRRCQNDIPGRAKRRSPSVPNRRSVRAGRALRCPALRRLVPGTRRLTVAGRCHLLRLPVRADARSPERLEFGRFATSPRIAKRVAIGCVQRGTTANPDGRKPFVFRRPGLWINPRRLWIRRSQVRALLRQPQPYPAGAPPGGSALAAVQGRL
jgi:hypothetical protein